MLKSNLPYSTLRNIWILGDVDKDGCLDEDEFALVCYLMQRKLEGFSLPASLPLHLVPPAKSKKVVNGGGPISNGHSDD